MAMRTMRLTLAVGVCAGMWVCALDPKAMIGKPPEGMSLYDRGTMERNGVKGTFFFCCDDRCNLAVNGKEIGASDGTRAAKADMRVRPGSVICVKVLYDGGGKGLALAFVSTNAKVSFAASAEGWYEYTPTDEEKWADIAHVDKAGLKECQQGPVNSYTLSVGAAAKVPCLQSIWGPSAGTTTYLLHVVTYADLVGDRKK